MKIKIKRQVEVEEEVDIPDAGTFYINEVDQNAMYGLNLNQRAPQLYDVDVRLTGSVSPEQMKTLSGLVGGKVSVVQVA